MIFALIAELRLEVAHSYHCTSGAAYMTATNGMTKRHPLEK
jgi:hypothetical protein